MALDTPGYGHSDRPATQPVIADYADAVCAVLDAIGVPGAHLVGHHTGAVIAVEMAAGHPERVASAVLSGPVYLDQPGRVALRKHFAQWHVRADGTHMQEKWDKFSKWESNAALLHRLVMDIFLAGETSEFGHFAVADYMMEERLPLVRCPGLMLCGTRDPFADIEHLPKFLEAFRPGSSLSIDGGIFLPNQSPEAFAKAVLDFTA